MKHNLKTIVDLHLMKFTLKFLILCCCLLGPGAIFSQKTIRGLVKDAHSEDLIPFASVTFKNTNIGAITDSLGQFSFSINDWPSDTLLITYVGYEAFYLPIDIKKEVLDVTISLERAMGDVVIVRSKIDKGLWLWKKLVEHKPENNRYKFDNFSYELYNKLEIDLKNFQTLQKIAKFKPLRPINDLINQNIDTSEGIKILPAYLTEAISNYYYQKKPLKRREEIFAANTNGVKNESMVKFLGGMDQVINVYNNFINVFNKEFVSPASENGDFYYKYTVSDTQYISGERYYHLLFRPRRKGMNTFEGDCWIHFGSYAIQKMTLALGKDADINFMDRFSYIQEFKRLADSNWFVSREKLVVDVAPVGNKTPGLIGRKTSTYRNIVVNDTSVVNRLKLNKELEEIVTAPNAQQKDKTYWETARHEELSRSEQNIVKMIDTILTTPVYQKLTKQLEFIGTGYFNVGNVQFGSAYNWFSGNAWEGFRMRFDVGSNKHFNKKFLYHSYLAYGFKDQKVKGMGELFYLPKKDPRQYWSLSYKNDLDFGQRYYGEISSDNIFSFAVRKPGVAMKFINLEETNFEFFNELRNGFSVKLAASNKTYTPLANLLPATMIEEGLGKLSSTEFSVRLRFAFLEKFIESTFYRASLGSPYPIVEATYTKAVPGILNSRYHYSKLLGSVSDYIKTPPFGVINYQLYAGRTFGSAPYMFLDVAPGNEMYYYNKYAFNTMLRYQYIHDRFAGINYEHNIGNGIFKILPRLKFRQFYTVKALWGSISEANKQLNFKEGSNFLSLDGKTYLELGTGVDNILRVLRVDFIWRVLPDQQPTPTMKNFGVFGSLRFNF
ncbi:DUF5686 family protein [Niabella insulamsoli]|uniref:DUF5686 and carboxypeptidase-like regulatory domain-containing protein n=1 Tax=Niabella insulamsoli TaxID=3144874 RepID=UPI0031FBDABA